MFIILGGIALCILFGLFVYTLIIFQSSLRKLNLILLDAELKLNKLNNLFDTVENVGEIAQKETLKLKNQYNFKNLNQNSIESDNELASWLISSLMLAIKVFKRR